MTRHARNCTAGAVYTYNEKKKDTKQSGYGSNSLRLGKDSVKEFDCCCLTLQPCRNPVITPDGFIYDKEAILEYILHKKKENARMMKEFEKQKTKLDKEAAELAKAEQESNMQKFVEKQSVVVGKFIEKSGTSSDAQPSTSNGASSSKTSDVKSKQLPSFWVPSLTPQATATKVKKPEETIRCPMSGKPIKLRELLDVKFTPINDGDKRSLITKTYHALYHVPMYLYQPESEGRGLIHLSHFYNKIRPIHARYVCPVTNDVLGNSVPCAVLKTSGSVVTIECIEKLIKKDMLDPTNGKKMTDKDIIPLQRGATGFSATGSKLQAKIDGPSMMA